MQTHYELKIDKRLRFTTKLIWIASFLPAGVGVFCAWAKLNPQVIGPCPLPWAVLPVFFAALVFIIFFRHFAPEGYLLNGTELIIERKIKPIVIPLREITEARLISDEELKWAFKLGGSEGFYGYYGLFWSKKLGKFKIYATRRKNLVAVRTAKTLYALSPENTEDFLANLKQFVKIP